MQEIKDAIEAKNKQIEKLKAISNKIVGWVYGATTKKELNEIATDLSSQYPDYRRYAMTKCLKGELVTNIQMVCTRSIAQHSEEIAKLEKQLSEEITREEKRLAREKNQKLVDRFSDMKKDYVMGFDEIEDGLDAWNSLVDGVLDGYIKESELPGFGIKLKG